MAQALKGLIQPGGLSLFYKYPSGGIMDDSTEENLVIESVKSDGQRFRPSDWIERISSSLATFGADHRLHYAADVQPCIIEGQKCLVVSKHLQSHNPAAYDEVMHFARDNDLRIQECRREESVPVKHERRKR